jgi:dihydroorotate dehydrogenase electron transfer subunit
MALRPPDRGHLPQAYRITAVRVENATVRTLVLDRPMPLTPGQFVMAWLPGLDEKPFSPSSADPLALTIQRVGPFTTAAHDLAVGDPIWLRGPFGRGFAPLPGGLMLIGGGCGAPPLHCLAHIARQAGRTVHSVLGARNAAALFFRDRFAALGCAVHVATDDGSCGHHGTAIDLAAALLTSADVQVSALYACGPEPMLQAAHLLARAHDMPCQLSYEAYMRCGIGVCGSCALGGCLVCRDGPVFHEPPEKLRGTCR